MFLTNKHFVFWKLYHISTCTLRYFNFSVLQFSSVTQSCPTLQPHGLQHTRLPCPSPAPGLSLSFFSALALLTWGVDSACCEQLSMQHPAGPLHTPCQQSAHQLCGCLQTLSATFCRRVSSPLRTTGVDEEERGPQAEPWESFKL